MTEKKKQEYNAPKVKVVSFVVERGYDTNYPSGQNEFYIQDAHELRSTGTRRPFENAASDWFYQD